MKCLNNGSKKTRTLAQIRWPQKAADETVNRLANKGFSDDGDVAGKLSGRELQVLGWIGGASIPAQIAAIMDVEVTTVDTCRSRIREKPGLKGCKRAWTRGNSLENRKKCAGN